jgi:hypothetical protein
MLVLKVVLVNTSVPVAVVGIPPKNSDTRL